MTSDQGTHITNCCCTPAPEAPANDDDRIRAWWADMQQDGFAGFELIPRLARLLAQSPTVAEQ